MSPWATSRLPANPRTAGSKSHRTMRNDLISAHAELVIKAGSSVMHRLPCDAGEHVVLAPSWAPPPTGRWHGSHGGAYYRGTNVPIKHGTLSYCYKWCQLLRLTEIGALGGVIMPVPDAGSPGRLSGVHPRGFLSFSIHPLQYV